MAQTILIKRGLEANRTSITPQSGELIWTTDNHDLWVGDGSTAGGIKVTANVEGSYIPLSQKGAANGVATLDASGLVPNSQIPPLAITSTYTAADQTAQLALTVQEGDVCVRTDENKSYIALNSTNSSMSDWQELLTPTDAVQSVNGQTGVVSLDTDDITEGSTNLYYTDARVNNYLSSTATLGGLSDVVLTSISDGQYITWDNANTRWVNTSLPAGVDGTFIGLNDTPSNYTGAGSRFVKVNSGASAVEFVTASTNDLSDVDTNTNVPASGDVLQFDGTNFVPVAGSSVGSTTFTGLTDTPANYTGSGGYSVRVNSGGTALEFVDVSTIDGGTF